MNHPYGIEIPDIRVYPLKPSYEEMVKNMNAASGRKDHSLPYSMRKSSGINALSICNPKWTACRNCLDSVSGIVSAATVLLETKRFMEFYEMRLANHGKGFGRFDHIDPGEQKKACIDFYGDSAAYYDWLDSSK